MCDDDESNTFPFLILLWSRAAPSVDPRPVQLRRIFRIRHHMLEPVDVDCYSTIVQLAERHPSLIIVVIVTMMYLCVGDNG